MHFLKIFMISVSICRHSRILDYPLNTHIEDSHTDMERTQISFFLSRHKYHFNLSYQFRPRPTGRPDDLVLWARLKKWKAKKNQNILA